MIDSSNLFSGTRAMAHVELAEVSRRTGDHGLAERFLTIAAEDPEADEETLVDAMMVRAHLLEDTGDMNGASEMWRNVLAAPYARDGQVRTARRLSIIKIPINHRRIRLQGGRRPGECPGPTCDDSSPARHRPHKVIVPAQGAAGTTDRPRSDRCKNRRSAVRVITIRRFASADQFVHPVIGSLSSTRPNSKL